MVTGALFVVEARDAFERNDRPMRDLLLRCAGRDESAAVAALFRRSRQAALPYLTDLHTTEEDRAFFRDRVFAECSVWVASRGGSLVGFCAVRDGWVDHLYVAPEQQRRGVGSALLDRAKRGQRELRLWTFQRNANARAFYEKHGFAVQCLTGGENEEREPDVLYVWVRDR